MQLEKATEICKHTIQNSEFSECNNEQKYSIFKLLLEAYRVSCEYNLFDKTIEIMHSLEITDNNEYIVLAFRYFEEQKYDEAEINIKKPSS